MESKDLKTANLPFSKKEAHHRHNSLNGNKICGKGDVSGKVSRQIKVIKDKGLKG